MSDANFSSRRENVRVVIRFRPVNKVEKAHEHEVDEAKVEPMTFDEKNGNIVLGAKQNKIWGFDGVCPPSTTQEDMFHVVAEQTCRDVVNGYNGTIFMYGQTGSGKTYTMYGAEDKPDAEQYMGLIPRCVAYIFDYIENDADIETFRVSCSFLEIYQERPRDLLNKAKHQDLKIRLNKRHETYMQGLVEHPVESLTEVLQLISIAVANRVTDSTDMNAVSSRSHMLMKMTVVIKLKNGTIRIAYANFADLAGSEKVKKSGARGQRLEEAKAINKSLSVLGQVIHSLSSGKGKHVPFRDSILTHVLRDSLGGNCKTTLVVSVSPHRYNRSESINSLRFGRRCKLVTNKASVNRVFSNEELMKKLAILEAKNDELQQMLKQRAFEAFTNSELPKQIETLQQELAAVKRKLAVVEHENENLDAMLKRIRFEKSELEDGAATDRDRLDAYAAQIDDYEALVERLRNEVVQQQQHTELVNGQHALMSQKVCAMELEQQSRAQQTSTLQLELATLRQFKHDAQQQNIDQMRVAQTTQDEMTTLRRQLEQARMQHEQQLAVQTKATVLAQKELTTVLAAATEQKQQAAFQEQVENEQEMQQKKESEREQIRVELRQVLALELRSEMESELNTKLSASREQFTAQLNELQATMQEMHTAQNAMRSELEIAQQRAQTLQSRDEQNSARILAFESEKESLARELEKLKRSVVDEQQRRETISQSAADAHTQHATQIEAYEEHKERLLQEKETLSTQLDETRQALDEIREDFKQREDLLSGRVEEQDNLIKRAQREHAKSKAKLQEQSQVVQASNQFIQRQHDAIKHRESKISVLKQEKHSLKKSNQYYKDIQEQIDQDIAKRLQEEEETAAKMRRVQLEQQRRKDEAYLRTMLLQEHSKNGVVVKKKENQDINALNGNGVVPQVPQVPLPMNGGVLPIANMSSASRVSVSKSKSKSKSRSKSGSRVSLHAGADEDLKMDRIDSPAATATVMKDEDVTRLMQRSNEMSGKNLSQLIGKVAMKQQQDRLLKQQYGGKHASNKSVLDLWIKAQMQLMCGQLPTICKKYGIQLRKLNDMYDGGKRSYQPAIDEFHYLKFRDENFDPREYDQLRSKENAANAKERASVSTPSRDASVLLAQQQHAFPPLSPNKMDPYNFYNGDIDGDVAAAADLPMAMIPRIEQKPQGFVAQPHSPPVSPQSQSQSQAAANVSVKSMPELDINQSENDEKKRKSHGKSKSKFGFLKRKPKKRQSKIDAQQNLERGQSDPLAAASSAMAYEDAPPPVPFGQYLNDRDLHQFERVVPANANPNPNANPLFDEDDEKAEFVPQPPPPLQPQPQSQAQSLPPLQSAQHRIPSKPNTQNAMISPFMSPQHNSNMSAHSNGTVVRHGGHLVHGSHGASQDANEPEYSRDFSISVINMSVMNEDPASSHNIPIMQPQTQAHNNAPPKTQPNRAIFEAMTQLSPIGEMAGVVVNAEFGILNHAKRNQSGPVLRVQLVNNNLNGAAISTLKLRFQRNHVGLNSSVCAIQLPQSIAPNASHRFNVPLTLNAHERNVHSNEAEFSFAVSLIVETNVFAIQCQIDTPVHIFFESKGYLPRDQFLRQWKSIKSDTAAKVKIGKARSTDIEQLKTLLSIHKLFFIHHRPIPNKGDILYYSCKMYGEALLMEISVAVSGEGTIEVRSNDRYKSVLCVHAVHTIIDCA